MDEGSSVGIVVPTLGRRPQFLLTCLRSIRNSGQAHIRLVAPRDLEVDTLVALGLVDSVQVDPGNGLARAIDLAIRTLPRQVKFVNWLGDDDLLKFGMLDEVASKIEEMNCGLVWGQCEYIDESGIVLFLNKSGTYARRLIHWGPNLISQPGALFSRESYLRVGGLSTDFRCAFDQDLFVKLIKDSGSEFLPKTLACFRWHPTSLSVARRGESVRESSEIRLRNRRKPLRVISYPYEYLLRIVILLAGKIVDARIGRFAKTKNEK